MSTPVRASDRDLRALAAIVIQDRPDLPDGEGLPPSLLADLTGQIRCDRASFFGLYSGRKADWFVQELVPSVDVPGSDDLERVYWKHYWDSQFCSYPSRTGDLGSLDRCGQLLFLGRIKDVLKVGGENVSPLEVEALLSTHPSVHLAQVVGHHPDGDGRDRGRRAVAGLGRDPAGPDPHRTRGGQARGHELVFSYRRLRFRACA